MLTPPHTGCVMRARLLCSRSPLPSAKRGGDRPHFQECGKTEHKEKAEPWSGQPNSSCRSHCHTKQELAKSPPRSGPGGPPSWSGWQEWRLPFLKIKRKLSAGNTGPGKESYVTVNRTLSKKALLTKTNTLGRPSNLSRAARPRKMRRKSPQGQEDVAGRKSSHS